MVLTVDIKFVVWALTYLADMANYDLDFLN
jgi:hypothetical protein